jgi:molecular chaperone DnaJ
MADAVMGTDVTLESLDGPVEIEVKPGVQSADVITIPGRGITRLRGSGRGDLRIGVQVVTPTKLDGRERELMRQLMKHRKPKPPQFAHFQQGLFTKLRDRFLGV